MIRQRAQKITGIFALSSVWFASEISAENNLLEFRLEDVSELTQAVLTTVTCSDIQATVDSFRNNEATTREHYLIWLATSFAFGYDTGSGKVRALTERCKAEPNALFAPLPFE